MIKDGRASSKTQDDDASHGEDQPVSDSVEVGYKRPPVKNQFQKGKSGNEKGRPRGRQSMKTELRAVAEETLEVNINGRPMIVTARMAMFLRLRQMGLGGDLRAIDRSLKLYNAHLPDDTAAAPAQTAEDDEAVLQEILAAIRDTSSPSGSSNDS